MSLGAEHLAESTCQEFYRSNENYAEDEEEEIGVDERVTVNAPQKLKILAWRRIDPSQRVSIDHMGKRGNKNN